MDLYRKVRLACRDGMSERAAARHFGVSRQSVRKMLQFSVPPGYRRTAPVRRPKLDEFTGLIEQWLGDDSRNGYRKQRHTAKRIFERLRDEHGFTGGYGRRRQETVIDNGRKRVRRGIARHNPQDWTVLLRDHHDGYITWDQFERNQELLSENTTKVRGAVRNGAELLTGLLRCGHCDNRIQARDSGKAIVYRCLGLKDRERANCISFRYHGHGVLAPLDAVDDNGRLLSSLVGGEVAVEPERDPLRSGGPSRLHDVGLAAGGLDVHAKACQVPVPEHGILLADGERIDSALGDT